MTRLVETRAPITTQALAPVAARLSVTEIVAEVMRKRHEDAIRFRTCCVDPRASK